MLVARLDRVEKEIGENIPDFLQKALLQHRNSLEALFAAIEKAQMPEHLIQEQADQIVDLYRQELKKTISLMYGTISNEDSGDLYAKPK